MKRNAQIPAVCLAFLVFSSVTALGAEPQQAAPNPNVLFSAPLPDMPGKDLVVVKLRLRPDAAQAAPQTARGHRHPGSVLVYVTEGVAELGIEGMAIQRVEAGGVFFEPEGAVHTVGRSAVAGQDARAIAVMIVTQGEELVLPVQEAP